MSVIAVPGPPEGLRLRPETPADADFRYRLFCVSRPQGWAFERLGPELFEPLMRQQFAAQTASYAQAFPQARFDVVELDGEPVGRIVVDRSAGHVHLVDQAVAPAMRGRGIGSALMRALLAEAAADGVPVRLKVADANDPARRFYERFGFVQVREEPLYLELERAP